MKKLLNIAFVSAIVWIAAGCSQGWLDETPPHLITAETLYTNLDGFEAGLNGLYSLVRREREAVNGASNNLTAMIATVGTDNLVAHNSAYIGSITQNWKSLNVSTNSGLSGVFLWLYKIVNAANTIINRAESGTEVDWTGGGATPEQNKNRVLAEAKALRAWAYRHLTFCWGDVPLSLEEAQGSDIKTDWERTPRAEVRNQIKADWLFAEQYLSAEPAIRGKISKGAVQHYLSELYLTIGKPDSALYWADQCINTPAYKLITERYGVKSNEPGSAFMDMFYEGNSNREEGNTEALWVWQWEYNVVGGGGSLMRREYSNTNFNNQIKIGGIAPLQYTVERGGRGIARALPSQWAINLYDPDDVRGSNDAIRTYYILKDATQNAPGEADRLPAGYNYGDTVKLDWSEDLVYTTKSSRNDWPFIRKWDNTISADLQASFQYNDQVYLRLAETYLLKAEAQFKLGNNAGAAETINIIRRRAHTHDISATDVTLDFILDERSRELITEEHRRYTLLRTGKWLERVQAHNFAGGNQTATARDTLYPIPQVVLDANLTKEMPQNPGF
ncbi:RagB/SusD family nutrient uptake outer membrane protein [Parapedobacter soli]|uniref:RagB/SusD family nutrient uptake outer membrane protein n=1 Tax=Parapedobacter soli TaxID=416955 RepID=UPI0021C5A791|nr:RagB/SusD family nutrient uptake outer membrane protein [Parapedobacter soli]